VCVPRGVLHRTRRSHRRFLEEDREQARRRAGRSMRLQPLANMTRREAGSDACAPRCCRAGWSSHMKTWPPRLKTRAVSSQLPSVSTTARGPLAQELSQEHDASEVIGVVNCQTNQNFSCGRLEYSSVRLRKAGGTIQDGRITGK